MIFFFLLIWSVNSWNLPLWTCVYWFLPEGALIYFLLKLSWHTTLHHCPVSSVAVQKFCTSCCAPQSVATSCHRTMLLQYHRLHFPLLNFIFPWIAYFITGSLPPFHCLYLSCPCSHCFPLATTNVYSVFMGFLPPLFYLVIYFLRFHVHVKS